MTRPVAMADDACAPPLNRLLAESLALVSRSRMGPDREAAAGRSGRGRRVVTLPGFMTHDISSWRLQSTLALAGYSVTPSGIGFNAGMRDHTIPRLRDLILELSADGNPVSLVGWSLGGLFAREVAKVVPDLVDRVITLASPFSGGNPRANNGWRLYEILAGRPLEQSLGDMDLAVKPPVPTFALWTPRDGIVSPASARGVEGERDFAIEVSCLHLEMVSDHHALVAVLDALEADTSAAAPEGRR